MIGLLPVQVLTSGFCGGVCYRLPGKKNEDVDVY